MLHSVVLLSFDFRRLLSVLLLSFMLSWFRTLLHLSLALSFAFSLLVRVRPDSCIVYLRSFFCAYSPVRSILAGSWFRALSLTFPFPFPPFSLGFLLGRLGVLCLWYLLYLLMALWCSGLFLGLLLLLLLVLRVGSGLLFADSYLFEFYWRLIHSFFHKVKRFSFFPIKKFKLLSFIAFERQLL